MTRVATGSAAANLARQMVETYALTERMNQLVLDALDPDVWRAAPPGPRARTIAAIVAHVHNVRCRWIRLSAPHLGVPAQLDRGRCTINQARSALRQSGARCGAMLREALVEETGRVERFRRDAYLGPWAPGAAMFTYMIAHEAHHRGQIWMLARQLGSPLSRETSASIWQWEKLMPSPARR